MADCTITGQTIIDVLTKMGQERDCIAAKKLILLIKANAEYLLDFVHTLLDSQSIDRELFHYYASLKTLTDP